VLPAAYMLIQRMRLRDTLSPAAETVSGDGAESGDGADVLEARHAEQ